MSDQSNAPQAEQVVRANRLRETMANIKRGARPEPKTPRDFTEQAAAEAARKIKPTVR